MKSSGSGDFVIDKSETREEREAKEIAELETKLADLNAELNLPQEEFEERLMMRLREEIKLNRARLETDLKTEIQQEKKKLIAAAREEKQALKKDNE